MNPREDGSVELRGVLSGAFMATVADAGRWAELYPAIGAPAIEREGEEWAAKLDAAPPLRGVRVGEASSLG